MNSTLVTSKFFFLNHKKVKKNSKRNTENINQSIEKLLWKAAKLDLAFFYFTLLKNNQTRKNKTKQFFSASLSFYQVFLKLFTMTLVCCALFSFI